MSSSVFNKTNPYQSKLKLNRKLTRFGSEKDTRHLELDLADSHIEYQPGDSLVYIPENDPVLVEKIINISGWETTDTVIDANQTPTTIQEVLLKKCDLQKITPKLIQLLSEKVTHPKDKKKFEPYLQEENQEQFKSEHRDVLDLLEKLPFTKLEPQEFIEVLAKLNPRYYSISSSQKQVGTEVHLTITVANTEFKNRIRKGIASSKLCWTEKPGSLFPIYIHSANHFRLPEKSGVPIIMVGPGTGIAPFRSFLQEREVNADPGKNWLFFGEQRKAYDFLYEEELLTWHQKGFLTELSLAFSRDQEKKIYVQHKMLEEGQKFWNWLEQGAYLYVCGDAKRMAKDVEDTLHVIVEKFGGKTPEEAQNYVKQMKREKRYLKDIY